MLTKDEITQIKQVVEEVNKPINKKLDTLVSEVSHIKTAIKPLATKEDVEAEIDSAKTEILSAVLALDSKVVTKVHKHTKSINALHEGTEIPDPNTH